MARGADHYSGEAQPALPMINFPMANDRHDGEDGDDDHACNGRDQRNYHKGTIWSSSDIFDRLNPTKSLSRGHAYSCPSEPAGAPGTHCRRSRPHNQRWSRARGRRVG